MKTEGNLPLLRAQCAGRIVQGSESHFGTVGEKERKMEMRVSRHVIFSAALIALGAGCLSAAAMAQDSQQAAKPMFGTLPPHNINNFTPRALPPNVLTTFTKSFVYNTVTYPFTMVGADPSVCLGATCNVAAPAFIIPIKIVIGASTFNPSHVLVTVPPETVTQNVKRSPMFAPSTWTLPPLCGVCSLPNRQYEDAYQKASLWVNTSSKPTYHDRLVNPPTVVAPVTLTCGTPNCTTGINPISGMGTVALVNLNLLDSTCQSAINANPSITPGAVAICLTYDTFLTSGSCCVGGFHSAYGGPSSQTYIYATWIDPINCVAPCQFSEDTAAVSSQVAAWIADPYLNNSVPYAPCSGLLEVEEPLPQHDYVQSLLGPPAYSYHVQDLVVLPYFYQAVSSAVNGWYTFDNEAGYIAPCSHGPALR